MEEREPTVSGVEAQHMMHVLRLKPGDRVEVFDGLGRSAQAEIIWRRHDAVGLRLEGEIRISTLSGSRIILAPALIRRDKMKFVFQKAVEIGATAIWPFECTRSVARSRQGKEYEFPERYERVLIEAMKQCGTNLLPVLAPPVGLEEVLNRIEPELLGLFLYENETSRGFKQVAKKVKPHHGVVLVVGPEGGFTPAEADTARAHGFYLVSLGRRILRAETAAIIAMGLAQYEWGDLDA
jgi:16S rRNA (uracil1498-N3)-methyltransferase